MQNYYNRQLEFDDYERTEYLNYLKNTGKIYNNFVPVSNYNSDFLTDKIGQEYNALRTPQTYFSRKFQGTLRPIDNNSNKYYDFYFLGKGGIPYGEYEKKKYYTNRIYSPYTLMRYNKLNLQNRYNDDNQLNIPNQLIQNIDYDANKYGNNNLNSNNNGQLNKNINNTLPENNNNMIQEQLNYNVNMNSANNNNYINSYNEKNINQNNKNTYDKEINKLPVSKSMSYFDYQDYKNKINEREKQLIGKYEDYHRNIQTQPNIPPNYNYNNNINEKNYYSLNDNSYNNNININNQNYQRNIRYFNQKERPCKIYNI